MERQQDERTLFEYERDMYSPIAQRQMEEYALEEEKAKNTRSTFRTFLDNFSGNLQRESERKLSENKALTEYLQTPEGKRASTAVGLGVASLLPLPGAKTRFANQMAQIMRPTMVTKKEPFLPETSRKINEYIKRQKNADEKMMFELMQIRNRSGSRVGTDVAGRTPMPQPKPQLSVVRGPRGPINIETPKQGNLNLRELKDTGITSLTNRMNPKMRNDLLGRRDRIQQDIFRMDSMQRQGEPVDMNRLFRLQDELDALNKTLK